MDVLAARLEARLAEDPNPPPQGYQLLGRSLMGLGEFEAALKAYEKAVDLSEGDTGINAEYERARDYVGSLSAPPLSDSMVETFSNLPEAQRDAAIVSMVDGLSARLAEDPADMIGWQRLLQSRRVLDQISKGQEELQQGLTALSDQPELQLELARIATTLGYRAQ